MTQENKKTIIGITDWEYSAYQDVVTAARTVVEAWRAGDLTVFDIGPLQSLESALEALDYHNNNLAGYTGGGRAADAALAEDLRMLSGESDDDEEDAPAKLRPYQQDAHAIAYGKTLAICACGHSSHYHANGACSYFSGTISSGFGPMGCQCPQFQQAVTPVPRDPLPAALALSKDDPAPRVDSTTYKMRRRKR